MRNVPYSAAKADLFTPWKRGAYFSDGEAKHTSSLCAELSRLAYCRKEPSFSFDQASITTVLAWIGFSRCKFVESPGAALEGGTHCFTAVGTDPDVAKQMGVVVFRGTDADDPTDIGTDADLLLKPWGRGGSVHTGFANALDTIAAGLDDAVQSLGVPVLFTGHSLGAALATLAASLFKPLGNVTGLYTFGSPLVGDSAFVATLDGVNIYRYRDCCDVVTRIPPPELDYVHVGPQRYIDHNGLITLNPSEAAIVEDQAAAVCDYLLHYAWKVGNVGVRDLADHSPINYVWSVATA